LNGGTADNSSPITKTSTSSATEIYVPPQLRGGNNNSSTNTAREGGNTWNSSSTSRFEKGGDNYRRGGGNTNNRGYNNQRQGGEYNNYNGSGGRRGGGGRYNEEDFNGKYEIVLLALFGTLNKISRFYIFKVKVVKIVVVVKIGIEVVVIADVVKDVSLSDAIIEKAAVITVVAIVAPVLTTPVTATIIVTMIAMRIVKKGTKTGQEMIVGKSNQNVKQEVAAMVPMQETEETLEEQAVAVATTVNIIDVGAMIDEVAAMEVAKPIIQNWAHAMNALKQSFSELVTLVSISTNTKIYPWKRRATMCHLISHPSKMCS